MSSLRDGVTRFGSGGAFLRARSERRLLPFIYPLVASRWGHPAGRVCFFAHSIVTKPPLVSCSGIPSGWGPPVGSGSVDLISNEGIATVGLLGAVSGHASGCPCVILWSAGLFCSVEWVPRSIVFASGMDSVFGPLANEGVGLGPSSSGPVASRPPLGIGLLRQPGR